MRANLKIGFDRPVSDQEQVSPGSFTIILKNGEKRQFDFIESAGGRDPEDGSIYECEFRGLDIDYEDGSRLTVKELRNVDKVEEIYISIYRESDEKDFEPLKVTKIFSFDFDEIDEKDQYVEASIPKRLLTPDVAYIDYES